MMVLLAILAPLSSSSGPPRQGQAPGVPPGSRLMPQVGIPLTRRFRLVSCSGSRGPAWGRMGDMRPIAWPAGRSADRNGQSGAPSHPRRSVSLASLGPPSPLRSQCVASQQSHRIGYISIEDRGGLMAPRQSTLPYRQRSAACRRMRSPDRP